MTRILLTDISSSFAVPSLKDKDKSYKVYDDWINLRKEAFSFGKLTKLIRGYDATTPSILVLAENDSKWNTEHQDLSFDLVTVSTLKWILL